MASLMALRGFLTVFLRGSTPATRTYGRITPTEDNLRQSQFKERRMREEYGCSLGTIPFLSLGFSNILSFNPRIIYDSMLEIRVEG